MVGVTDDLFPLAILAYFRSGASLIGSMGLVYFPSKRPGCGGYGHWTGLALCEATCGDVGYGWWEQTKFCISLLCLLCWGGDWTPQSSANDWKPRVLISKVAVSEFAKNVNANENMCLTSTPKRGLNFPTFFGGAGIRGYSFYLHILSVFSVLMFFSWLQDGPLLVRNGIVPP